MGITDDELADEGRLASDGLGAALNLSDGICSLVVLQTAGTERADDSEQTDQEDGIDRRTPQVWASFLPAVLAGHRTVSILCQQPTETLAELRSRIEQRLSPTSHDDFQRLIWVAPPELDNRQLESLHPSLAGYSADEREVLLVSGARVVLIANDSTDAISDPETVEPPRPSADLLLSRPLANAVTRASKSAPEGMMEQDDSEIRKTPPETHAMLRLARADRAKRYGTEPRTPHSYPPERSEVRWDAPDDHDDPDRHSEGPDSRSA